MTDEQKRVLDVLLALALVRVAETVMALARAMTTQIRHNDALLVVDALWVHQREQIDHPVPEGWYICHEDYTTPTCTGSRRVGVAPSPVEAIRLGAANSVQYPAGPTRRSHCRPSERWTRRRSRVDGTRSERSWRASERSGQSRARTAAVHTTPRRSASTRWASKNRQTHHH